jgi:hypothetical protein
LVRILESDKAENLVPLSVELVVNGFSSFEAAGFEISIFEISAEFNSSAIGVLIFSF